MRVIAVGFCLLAVGVSACAPTSQLPSVDAQLAEEEAYKQRLEAVTIQVGYIQRVQDISFQIAKANTELCGDQLSYRTGFAAHTLDHWGQEWRVPLRNGFGVTERLTVLAVFPDSPAMAAGLTAGDQIIAINGKDIGVNKASLRRIVQLMDEYAGGTLQLQVDRNGSLVKLDLTPIPTCAYPTQIIQDNTVNAYADGKRIYVTAGMINFAASDDDLALVIGHELAHNTRNHVDSKLGNRLIGAIVGALATGVIGVDMTQIGADVGGAAFSQEFEAEADYVGVYHAARAGYNVREAAALWRRMAVMHPQAIHLEGSTHPSTAKRFLAIEGAAAEVARKRAGNFPLIPEEKQ